MRDTKCGTVPYLLEEMREKGKKGKKLKCRKRKFKFCMKINLPKKLMKNTHKKGVWKELLHNATKMYENKVVGKKII